MINRYLFEHLFRSPIMEVHYKSIEGLVDQDVAAFIKDWSSCKSKKIAAFITTKDQIYLLPYINKSKRKVLGLDQNDDYCMHEIVRDIFGLDEESIVSGGSLVIGENKRSCYYNSKSKKYPEHSYPPSVVSAVNIKIFS